MMVTVLHLRKITLLLLNPTVDEGKPRAILLICSLVGRRWIVLPDCRAGFWSYRLSYMWSSTIHQISHTTWASGEVVQVMPLQSLGSTAASEGTSSSASVPVDTEIDSTEISVLQAWGTLVKIVIFGWVLLLRSRRKLWWYDLLW